MARGQLKETDGTASHLPSSLALDGKRGQDEIRKVKCSRGDNAMTMKKGMNGSRSAQRAVRGHATSSPPAAAGQGDNGAEAHGNPQNQETKFQQANGSREREIGGENTRRR